MKQYTITYHTAKGAARFMVIEASSTFTATERVRELSPGCMILRIRENNPKLLTVTAIESRK